MTINKAATRKAIDSLRNAREDKRARGLVLSNNGTGCACYFLAKGLEIDVLPYALTNDVINQIMDRTGIPSDIMEKIPGMNDTYAVSAPTAAESYEYSFAEIAAWLEEAVLYSRGGDF